MTKAIVAATTCSIAAYAQHGSNPLTPMREGMDRKEAVKTTDNIYKAGDSF